MWNARQLSAFTVKWDRHPLVAPARTTEVTTESAKFELLKTQKREQNHHVVDRLLNEVTNAVGYCGMLDSLGSLTHRMLDAARPNPDGAVTMSVIHG